MILLFAAQRAALDKIIPTPAARSSGNLKSPSALSFGSPTMKVLVESLNLF